jgi:hypothetical protein
MALLALNKKVTLVEVNKATGNLNAAEVISELAQTNSFIDEVPWFPSTHGSHNEQFKARTLGTGAFTAGNDPVPIIASTGDIVKEPVRIYQADSAVDNVILEAADDPAAARDAQDIMNLEGIMQDINHALLYASASQQPDAYLSFSDRRKALGDYCVDGGGTGSGLSSLWLFEFGKRGAYMTYNRAGAPGLRNEDKGLIHLPVYQADGVTPRGYYWGWVRHYAFWAGIVIANNRGLQRLANLDPANPFPTDKFIEMTAQLPTMGGQNAIAFANRVTFAQIEKMCFNKANMSYSMVDIEGFGPVPRIAGIMIRPWEAISDNETAIA